MPYPKIGTLAERTGTNAPTIRYYEEIGLLRAADRQSAASAFTAMPTSSD